MWQSLIQQECVLGSGENWHALKNSGGSHVSRDSHVKICLEENHVPWGQWPHEQVNLLPQAVALGGREWFIKDHVAHAQEMEVCPQ